MPTGTFHLMAENDHLGTFETLAEARAAAIEEDGFDMWIAEDTEWSENGDIKNSRTHKVR